MTSESLSDAVILMEKTKERSAKILSTVYYAFSETQYYKWSLLLILLKYVDQDWRCSILKFMYILTVGFYVNKVLGICALFSCSVGFFFFPYRNILQVTPKLPWNYCMFKFNEFSNWWFLLVNIHTSKTPGYMLIRRLVRFQ